MVFSEFVQKVFENIPCDDRWEGDIFTFPFEDGRVCFPWLHCGINERIDIFSICFFEDASESQFFIEGLDPGIEISILMLRFYFEASGPIFFCELLSSCDFEVV